jgi:hypothetical protein
MSMRRIASAALVAALLAAPAVAQMPAPTTQNGIAFVTGGVGRTEVDAFRQAAADYNLRVTFTAPGGVFLAKVNVVLADGQEKKLVETVTQGPFFFAKVPAGTYNLTASYGGQTQQRRMVVSAGGAATADISFNAPVGGK